MSDDAIQRLNLIKIHLEGSSHYMYDCSKKEKTEFTNIIAPITPNNYSILHFTKYSLKNLIFFLNNIFNYYYF